VKRAFKYRFYPTDAQAAELSRTFGCVRKVYNLALEARTDAWKSRRERVGYNATSFLPLLCDDPGVKPLPAHSRRRDGLHKLTTRLVRENQTIVIEDLTVRNLLKNGHLARAIADAAWSEFRSMLEYKATWYGREVIVVDRWLPSSKLCSIRGDVTGTLPLDDRIWTCGCGCGATHDRDVNAAKNLLAAGPAVSACGAGVRPQRDPSRSGLSALKQEALQREP
jgi:IS605 OrfB family transposase